MASSMSVPRAATGKRYRKKRAKEMPEVTPMSMFWGLPTMVAVEPMLEAMASAMRKGTGLVRSMLHA